MEKARASPTFGRYALAGDDAEAAGRAAYRAAYHAAQALVVDFEQEQTVSRPDAEPALEEAHRLIETIAAILA